MDISFHGATDQGKRPTNEDHFSIVEFGQALNSYLSSLNGGLNGGGGQRDPRAKRNCFFLTVADGVGGHEGGELASRLAIKSLLEYWTAHVDYWLQRYESPGLAPATGFQPFEADLLSAVRYSQQALIDETLRNPRYRGMATTLTSACIIGGSLYCVHVGDSRCYVLRDGQLTQITNDHTMAQMIKDIRLMARNGRTDGGQGAPIELPEPPPGLSNVLWNVVGTLDESIQPETIQWELHDRDAILLCTDGLNKHLSLDQIQDIVRQNCSEKQVVEQLIAETNRAGGSDNTTVIFGRCHISMGANLTARVFGSSCPVVPSSISSVDVRP